MMPGRQDPRTTAPEATGLERFRLSGKLLLNWLDRQGAGPSSRPAELRKGAIIVQPRLDFRKAPPAALKAVQGLEQYLAHCSLEPFLLHLPN
jgi:hypothetical protein